LQALSSYFINNLTIILKSVNLNIHVSNITADIDKYDDNSAYAKEGIINFPKSENCQIKSTDINPF
jgi:hypothetical protein